MALTKAQIVGSISKQLGFTKKQSVETMELTDPDFWMDTSSMLR